jgi:hypothetical protein
MANHLPQGVGPIDPIEIDDSAQGKEIDDSAQVKDLPSLKHLVDQRIAEFQPPVGFSVFKPKRIDDSIAYSFGVRVVKVGIGEQAFKEGAFFCLASDKCAQDQRRFSVKKSLSVATTHLQHYHGIIGENTQHNMKRKGTQDLLSTKRSRELDAMEPSRFWLLTLVLCFVRLLLPFRAIEVPEMRAVLSGLHGFQTTSSKMVRRVIVEIYTAAKESTMLCLSHARDAAKGAIPIFHLNVDLWKSTSSHCKYIGVRIFFVDANFNFVSKLLAVRAFLPTSSLLADVPRMSDVLRLWVRGVLSEYGLRESDLASTTTDAGSDIKRLCSVLLPCPWDWCVSHLLNCVLVEAFGTALRKEQSGNPDVRTVLMRVKKVIEHVNKSDSTKLTLNEIQMEYLNSSLSLLSDVPQRWRSTVNCLERVLELFDILRLTYSQLGVPFDLDEPNLHTLLCELYSLMHPVAALITEAQACSPVAPTVVVSFCHIANIMDPRNPLPIFDPKLQLLDPKGFRPEMRDHSVLQPLTQSTRALLLTAMRTRFYSSYAESQVARSKMMDMAVFFFPPMRTLRYIDCFVRIGASVMSPVRQAEQIDLVRSSIHDEVIELAVRVREAQLGDDRADSEVQQSQARGVLEAVRSAAQQCSSSAPMQQWIPRDLWESLGESEHGAPLPGASATPGDMARAELSRYLSYALTSADDLSEKPQKALAWWRRHAAEFPLLSTVARSVLGKPVSSAAIERDFGEGGVTITPRRNRLDAGCVEMCLFLHQNMDAIPPLPRIPPMTAAQAKAAFPKRFCGAEFLETEQLWRSEMQDEDGENGDTAGVVDFE